MSQQTTEAPTGGATRRRRRSDLVAASERQLESWWALTVCLRGVAASALVMGTGHWRRGAMVFAASVLLAGVLRAVLPEDQAGLLAVRGRWADAVSLLVLGSLMVVVILTR